MDYAAAYRGRANGSATTGNVYPLGAEGESVLGEGECMHLSRRRGSGNARASQKPCVCVACPRRHAGAHAGTGTGTGAGTGAMGQPCVARSGAWP